MKIIQMKIEIPEDLEPRIAALAKIIGLPFDETAQLMMYNGVSTHLRRSVEWSETLLREDDRKEAAV